MATNDGMQPSSSTSSTAGLFISAPGKIILFGEHAVVYGRTAVAGSIDLRTYVSLYTSADGRIYLSLPDLGVERTWMLKDLQKAADKLPHDISADKDGPSPPPLETIVPMARKLSGSCEEQCGVQHLAILAFWYLLLGVAHRKRDMLAVKVTVRFKLPSCVGLGSSGAYCVCVAAALLQSTGLIPPPSVVVPPGGVADAAGGKTPQGGVLTWDDKALDTIRRWASAAEALIHGRASGLDAAVCTYGGVASFKSGSRIQHFRNLPDLRVILINSKVERNTSRMVSAVKDRKQKYQGVVEGIFDAIDQISLECIRILNGEGAQGDQGGTTPPSRRLSPAVNGANHVGPRPPSGTLTTPYITFDDGQHRSLQELCRINNQLLIALGVGHPKIDQISTLLARYGIHPKMTGAGGGGSLYAFLKPDTSQTVMDMMRQEITKLGYELWQPPLGGAGVLMHTSRPEHFATPQKLSQKHKKK